MEMIQWLAFIILISLGASNTSPPSALTPSLPSSASSEVYPRFNALAEELARVLRIIDSRVTARLATRTDANRPALQQVLIHQELQHLTFLLVRLQPEALHRDVEFCAAYQQGTESSSFLEDGSEYISQVCYSQRKWIENVFCWYWHTAVP